MYVYATGMNPVDCNALKRAPRVAIFQAFEVIIDQLKENGHEVTWKATKVGDKIPHDVDAIIVSSMLPRSLNCPYALGVMWAMSEAIRREIPLIIYLTDWAFFRSNSEFKSIAKAGVPYFSKKIGGALQYNEDPDMIVKHGDELVEICRQYAHGGAIWQEAEIMVPKYTNWGSMEIVKNYLPYAKRIHPMDPTPVFVRYLLDGGIDLPVMNQNGGKQWILPSLLNDDTWLNKQSLTWPVARYGPKEFPVVSSEKAVQELYRNFAGALCPPYPTEGSGWWRSRWIHSAISGSCLYAGFGDQLEAGEPYRITPANVERTNDAGRLRIAQGQRELMWNKLQLDPEVLTHQVANAFGCAEAAF